MLKRLIILLLTTLISLSVYAQERDSLVVMFWNLENFFDWKDQGTSVSDTEFSSKGKKFWTSRKFYAKCNTISKTIFWIGDRYDRLPDVMGYAEVENKGVISKLLKSTLLRKKNYGIVHFESSDRRGIDVGLIYRKDIFRFEDSSTKLPMYEGKTFRTREMLQVGLVHIKSGERYDFIVCHHPSKYGGAEKSQGKRLAAMESLRDMCDSLNRQRVVVMGDFNDIPTAPQFELISQEFDNKADEIDSSLQGTIRYAGKWELIDMFMVSKTMSDNTRMDILRPPFLMVKDTRHSGEKPLRTYSGPRYLGGVSDHLPIVLLIY